MAVFFRAERQGVYRRLGAWHVELVVRLDEVRKHSLDFSSYLAPDSLEISSASADAQGPTLSALTTGTSTVSFTSTGPGYVDLTLTLSDGSTRILRLDLVLDRVEGPYGDYS